jgi:archaetidylinositol phosphate synthase
VEAFMRHIREHRSLLAAAETRLLVRIARALPASVTSDHLTLLAFLSLLAAGPAFAAIPRAPGSAAVFVLLLALNWFGDSLDGTVARVRNQQRPQYGYYVDHVLDLAGTATLIAGLAASGVMTLSIALAVLAAYATVAAERFLATHTLGVFRLSTAGFGPTELRIVLAIGAIKVAIDPWVHVAGRSVLLFDVGGVVAIVGLCAAFVFAGIRNATELARIEPPLQGRPALGNRAVALLTKWAPSSEAMKFFSVGVLGFIVQLSALTALTSLAHWQWLPATIAAVEMAIVHNYVWHERWTWKRRTPVAGFTGSARLARFARFAMFNITTGLTSILGNVVLTGLFLSLLRVPVVAANALTVLAMSGANFALADRWVFRCPSHHVRWIASVLSGLALLTVPSTVSAAPTREALDAWSRYVAAVEQRMGQTPAVAVCLRPGERISAEGMTLDVPSGTISDWHGTVFLHNVTLDRLADRLQHPGTPPPQEDIVSSHVLERGPDSLRVSIRLVRHAVVRVTYDTEHEMTFERQSPTVMTARSIATRIDEVGGGDRGFLWRLNSYWRYDAMPGGVAVTLGSLTLSRDVPAFLRPLAAPIVARIARESMIRTLEALRTWFE